MINLFLEVSNEEINFYSANNLLGKHVCHTWSDEKNGWCGDVTQILGDSIRIENYKVFCGSGGFLGICTNITIY